MTRFKFRLERLMDYRRLQEKWAKDEFVGARRRRLDGESQVEQVKTIRTKALDGTFPKLPDRLAHEAHLDRLDAEQGALEAAVSVLLGEEESARDSWIETKQNLEALEKLRAKDYEEWQVVEGRREQAELDEWAVLRRAA
ncbi:MAG: flagellar FliJ family protein [Armatimonadetes bacterium]|nr:flagellar FliJ family protein [Armatimonadota bacterium]